MLGQGLHQLCEWHLDNFSKLLCKVVMELNPLLDIFTTASYLFNVGDPDWKPLVLLGALPIMSPVS